jgi:hypothetical protein
MTTDSTDTLAVHVIGLCRCGAAFQSPSHRYCRACKNAYVRKWRRTHRLTADERVKANARRIANMAVQRGRLIPQPCEFCGQPAMEKHHDDYSRPLDVRWFCAVHHAVEHGHTRHVVKTLRVEQRIKW